MNKRARLLFWMPLCSLIATLAYRVVKHHKEEPKAVCSWADHTILHTIRPGDTLCAISKKYGVSISELRRDNQLRGNKIIAGETLFIQRGGK